MRKQKKSTLTSCQKDSSSSTRGAKNIIEDFSNGFIDATSMWNELSGEFDSVTLSDKEFSLGLKKMGETIAKFNETQEILKSKDGINIEDAIKIVEKRKTHTSREYPFIIFVILT